MPVFLKRSYASRGGALWGKAFELSKETKIGYKELETAFRRDPLIFKGITKKAEDLFREGWSIEDPRDGYDVPDEFEAEIERFNEEIQLKQKLMQLAINTFIYGDGFLELDDGGNANEEISYGELKDVHIIYPPAMKISIDEYGIVQEYVFRWKGNEVKFHPSRIIHTKFYSYGDSNYGISVIEVAYNNLLAKMNADVAAGHIIYMAGKPFPVLKKLTRANEQEMDKMEEILKNLNPKTGLALDGDFEFDLKNPSPLNPTPFNNNFYINLAAALRMPLMILIGVQKGAVTGSEVDLSDYYKDIKNLQEIVFTPVLRRIYEARTGKKPFSYTIYWHPIFIDEKSEAEIFKIKCQCAQMLYNIGYPYELIWETVNNLEFNIDRIKEAMGLAEAAEQRLDYIIEAANEDDRHIIDELTKKEWERERQIAKEVMREWENADL